MIRSLPAFAFFIASVELKTNSSYRLSSLFSFFFQFTFGLLHPYCNSLVCFVGLFLEIKPKTI